MKIRISREYNIFRYLLTLTLTLTQYTNRKGFVNRKNQPTVPHTLGDIILMGEATPPRLGQ